MTIKERIAQIIASKPEMNSAEPASLEKLVYMAYMMGREDAAKEISDDYNAHIAAQKERAAKCRYHKMAAEVVGPEDYLYHTDYRQDITKTFGDDPADI